MQTEKIKEVFHKARDKIRDTIENVVDSNSKKSRLKLLLKITVAIVIALTLLYVVGYVSQWLQDIFTREELRVGVNDNLFYCIFEAFSGKPLTMFMWLILILAIFCIGFFLWSSRVDRAKVQGEEDERDFIYSESGDFGTNKSLTSEETTEKLNFYSPNDFGECDEYILGEELETKRIITAKPIKESYLNPNMAILGTPGTMKTRAVINNYMLQSMRQGRSVFCIDTKGSLYSDFYEYGEKQGYEQRVLNLVELDKSDGFDPVSLVREDPDLVDVFAQVIIDNTTDENDKDRFFDSGEMALLKAITLLVTYDGGENGYTYIKDEKERNFITIYKTIVMSKIEDLTQTFNAIAEVEPTHPALYPWNLFLKGGKVSNNFIIGLGSRLQLLQNRKVQNLFSHNDIDVSLLGKRKCIYYMRIPDTNTTYNFISSLFITLIYVKLIAQADANESLVLDVLVTALLDEFCTTGKIPDFTKKISSVRSRGVATIIAIQNIPQIKERYEGGAWEEILSDCDTKLFLGTNDNTTAEYLSKECGTTTIATQSKAYRYDTSFASPMMFNDSNSTNERNVYTPGEVRTLDIWQELILIRGMNVYRCGKFDYTKHPDYPKLTTSNITQHVPRYERMRGELQNTPVNTSFEKSEPVVEPKAPQSTPQPDTQRTGQRPTGKPVTLANNPQTDAQANKDKNTQSKDKSASPSKQPKPDEKPKGKGSDSNSKGNDKEAKQETTNKSQSKPDTRSQEREFGRQGFLE